MIPILFIFTEKSKKLKVDCDKVGMDAGSTAEKKNKVHIKEWGLSIAISGFYPRNILQVPNIGLKDTKLNFF